MTHLFSDEESGSIESFWFLLTCPGSVSSEFIERDWEMQIPSLSVVGFVYVFTFGMDSD